MNMQSIFSKLNIYWSSLQLKGRFCFVFFAILWRFLHHFRKPHYLDSTMSGLELPVLHTCLHIDRHKTFCSECYIMNKPRSGSTLEQRYEAGCQIQFLWTLRSSSWVMSFSHFTNSSSSSFIALQFQISLDFLSLKQKQGGKHHWSSLANEGIYLSPS